MFLIIGCQRSGTTLVKFILESHPDVVCFEENCSYNILANHLEAVRHKNRSKLRAGFKVPRWTEQLFEPIYSDLGEPSRASSFSEIPDLIFLIRDPRSVVASMITTMIGAQSWIDVAGSPILKGKIAESESFRTRYRREIDWLNQAKNYRAAAGALYWLYKTEALFEYESRNCRLLRLPYEQLISSPGKVLPEVVSFLGLRWCDSVLRPEIYEHYHMSPDGSATSAYTAARPIDTSSVDRFRQVLSRDDIEDIGRIATRTANELGYEIAEN